MRPFRFSTWMLAPLALALGGAAVLGVLAYRSVDVLVGTADLVEHTQEVLSALDDVSAHLKDAHRGERGYIITGEERFLAPFASAQERLRPALARVEALVSDHPAQGERAQRLDRQAAEALRLMEEAVDVRREVGFAAARAEVESGRINALIDAASATIAAMEATERALLAERSARAGASALRTRTMVLLGTLFAGLLTVLGAVVLIRDLRAQRALAAALTESREHFRALVETAGSAIVGVDADYCVVEFNPEAERLAGLRRADVLGRPLAELFAEQPGFDAFERLVARALEGEPVREFDAPFRAADGTTHVLLWNLARWEDGRGRALGAIAVGRDITLRKRMEEALRHEAAHDALTGLLNRRAFGEALEASLRARPARRAAGGILLLDLDRFKQVNDTLGHAAGDALLRLAADRLRAALDERSVLARLGGDEFAVLLPEAACPAAVRAAAERLRAALAAPYDLDGTRVSAPASLGGVVLDPALPAGELLRRADVAMYAAKADGGQPRLYAPAMDTCSLDTLAGPVAIERGLERGEFVVYYQPLVRLAGVRADVRAEAFADDRAAWDEQTLTVGHHRAGAALLGSVARVSRFGETTPALTLDGYAVLAPRTYANARLRWAEDARVMPRWDALAEVYYGVGAGVEVSAGYRRATAWTCSRARRAGPTTRGWRASAPRSRRAARPVRWASRGPCAATSMRPDRSPRSPSCAPAASAR